MDLSAIDLAHGGQQARGAVELSLPAADRRLELHSPLQRKHDLIKHITQT